MTLEQGRSVSLGFLRRGVGGGLPWPLRVGCLLLAGRSPRALRSGPRPRLPGRQGAAGTDLTEAISRPVAEGTGLQPRVLRLQRARQACLGGGPPRASLPALTRHSQRLVLQSWEVVTPEKCIRLSGDPSVDCGGFPPGLPLTGPSSPADGLQATPADLSPGPWPVARTLAGVLPCPRAERPKPSRPGGRRPALRSAA